MDYLREAENILRKVNLLEKALDNLKRHKGLIIQRNAPQGCKALSFDKPASAPIDKETLTELCEYAQCIERITATEYEIKRIKDIISQLSCEEQNLIQLWYIDGMSKDEIKEKLYISSHSTLYKLQRQAVSNFALLYFGAIIL